MNHIRSFGLLACAVLLTACNGGGSPTAPPASIGATPTATAGQSAAPTAEPTVAAPSVAVTQVPSASLDPSLSDAGIAARVTLSNDSRGRDGTHDIYGVDEDGSECSGSFEEPEYIVVAWYDDAPNGLIHRFGITVAADDIPTSDGSTTDIVDGGLSFSFVSESGLGTQYTGNGTVPNEGSVTIDVTRAGTSLTFDFEGVTREGANFVGQFICADA